MDKVTERIIEAALAFALVIAEAVAVSNIVGVEGYCSTPFEIVVHCNIIWLILFVIVLLFSTCLVLVSRLLWKKSKKAIEKILYTPRIKHWFELPNHNDLRLYVHLSRFSKKTRVEYSFNSCKDILGRDFLAKYRSELIYVYSEQGQYYPNRLFFNDLSPNDKIEIELSNTKYNEIALYFGSTLIHGIPNSTIEYTVGCSGEYLGRKFSLPDFSIWLTILDGELTTIRKRPT